MIIESVDPPLSINQNFNICAINVKLLVMAHHSIYVPTIISRQHVKRNDTNYTFYLYSYVQYLLWYIDQGYVTRKNHSQTLVTLLKVVQLVAIIASCIKFLPSSLITSLQSLLHTSWQTSYQIMHTSCLASCLIFRDANLC